jgi:hypothetical protein
MVEGGYEIGLMAFRSSAAQQTRYLVGVNIFCSTLTRKKVNSKRYVTFPGKTAGDIFDMII